MANPGQVIENGRGHRIIFRKTSADTNGELLQFEEYLAPNGLGPPEHIHLRQVERLQVLSGTMSAKISGRQQRIRAGDEVAIPAGKPHRWWNDGEEELHLRTEFRPALHFEWIIERAFELMAKSHGAIKPEEIAPLLNHYKDEYQLVGIH